MAQFDVHKYRSKEYPLVLDVQADVLSRLSSRTVVPLAPKRAYSSTPLTHLNPVVRVRGVEYVAVFQEIAAISITELGEIQGSLAGRRPDLIAALDFLFTGS